MGLFFATTMEPPIKRAVAFIDGQNLFYAAKNAFGYNYPNYEVAALAAALCRMQGWQLAHGSKVKGCSMQLQAGKTPFSDAQDF
jgi:hypothetical protein